MKDTAMPMIPIATALGDRQLKICLLYDGHPCPSRLSTDWEVHRTVRSYLPLALLMAAVLLPSVRVFGQDQLTKAASWSFPSREAVRAELDTYLATQQIEPAVQEAIDAIWDSDTNGAFENQQLDHVASSCALVDPQVRKLVEFCRQAPTGSLLPDFSCLSAETLPPFVQNNLRLLYARWLAQHSYFDESLQQLEGLTVTDVVDPAALLFYRCAGYHRLLDKQECLSTAEKLLEQEDQLPLRYTTLARLIQADLQPLKKDSLDEVSRLMDEVRRRLNLRRAGKRVRNQEDEIIAKLDKMIEQIEQQQQQQQQAANAGAAQPNRPAEDSLPAGGKGPGRVDSKQIGNKSGWGNLPPQQRQEALQQIGKDLPAHYREVIEEYFRKLAREERTNP